jgi:hypothetical protein
MAAWGTGVFNSQNAQDWVYELEGADDLALCRDALEEAAETNGYLQEDEGAWALAAAEVIASAAGRRGPDLPDAVESWIDTVRAEPTADDLVLARRAITRVRGGRSELAEIWAAAPTAAEWLAVVDDLERRLA